jgi:molybdate transport system ATP-binding protein
VLLLDEPLAGLDRDLRDRVLDYLRRVRDHFAVPIVYVTHEAGDAAALAGEVVRLEGGRIVDRGLTHEMLEPDPGAVRLRRPPPR